MITNNNKNTKTGKLNDVRNWVQYAAVLSDVRLYEAFIQYVAKKLIERNNLNQIMLLLAVLNDFMTIHYTTKLHDTIKNFLKEYDNSDSIIITIKYTKSFDNVEKIVDNGFITIDGEKGKMFDLRWFDKEICGPITDPLL